MAIIRIPGVVHAKKLLRMKTSMNNGKDVPKGCCAVYVGEAQKKRFVIPVWYLNHDEFKALLSQAVEEYGYSHPMGGLTIPCPEHIFLSLTSRLSKNERSKQQEEDSQLCSTHKFQQLYLSEANEQTPLEHMEYR
ncbi:auxin-responsive protein SAUR24-like [Humulus lupulus]|uniref:auxin-responsive protein SAUR24-like n=1 Tax=Humulus lupulus TaxID=3486 RepID=UPI002B41431C|nr:auxin-responsive protein SAUR24-like [Humulus lupulus]